MYRQQTGVDESTVELEPGERCRQKTLLAEMVDQVNMGNSQDDELRNKYFYVSGYVAFMKNDDRSFYLACPECKKKVMEESCGWRCESCDRAQPTCVPTYMLLAKIADVSDAQFINFYRDEGTALMGLKAEKLRELKEQGDI